MELGRRLLDFAQDYPQLLAMQRESYVINFPDQEMIESWFHSSLEAAAYYHRVWLYLFEGEIAAWLWLDWDDPDALHICHLQVKTGYWGRGIGRVLVEDALLLAKEKGKQKVTLNVTKSNTRALALYTHMGFVSEQDYGERQLMCRYLVMETNDVANDGHIII